MCELLNRALSTTITDTALSRTGEDSSSLRNCHDFKGGCPTDLVLHVYGGHLDLSVVGMRGHQLECGPGGHLRPVVLAGLGQETKTHSHLTGVHWELQEVHQQKPSSTLRAGHGRSEPYFLARDFSVCSSGSSLQLCSVLSWHFSMRT